MTACTLVRSAYAAIAIDLDGDGRSDFDALLGEGPGTGKADAVLAMGGEVG